MEAFGTILEGGQAGFRLTTKEYDPEAGAYYFNARWYESTTQRWAQQEARYGSFVNPYLFASNRPTVSFDPDGYHSRNSDGNWVGGRTTRNDHWWGGADSDGDGVKDSMDDFPHNPMLPADAPRAKPPSWNKPCPKQSWYSCCEACLDPLVPDSNFASAGIGIASVLSPPIGVVYGTELGNYAVLCMVACASGKFEF